MLRRNMNPLVIIDEQDSGSFMHLHIYTGN